MSDDSQKLPERSAVTCEGCGRRVHFKVVQTRPSSRNGYNVAYLVCPVCGHRATQLVEVAETARKRHAIVGGVIT